VSGQVAYEEEGARVKPIGVFSEDLGIKDASTRLVFNHLNSFADHKVIRQRHQVRIVPVTKVTYEWKGKLHVFYVYGYENKIHLPKYPPEMLLGMYHRLMVKKKTMLSRFWPQEAFRGYLSLRNKK